ncbi:hypothetical protein TRIP_D300123 [uncultured Paludibacter sp.]|nr:hypothetical protein TRIP_D300123 [uncultured Paludibacter sp.]
MSSLEYFLDKVIELIQETKDNKKNDGKTIIIVKGKIDKDILSKIIKEEKLNPEDVVIVNNITD